ncbi:Conserved_hypothetical protein [Hexamita inflata]|uniref:Uncharacterized protein n=1 Tax=Hexamita inflata TaxID=28002 RepID=A0AA86P4Q3_9EUKA|nr:Conserved hypothetical protein [Hexamita inflata]CAI9959466.1 Conserved hypothetical protein [Hexamita inflata]
MSELRTSTDLNTPASGSQLQSMTKMKSLKQLAQVERGRTKNKDNAEKKIVTIADVENELNQLKTTINHIQKISVVVRQDDHIKIDQLNKDALLKLINPLVLENEKEAVKKANDDIHEYTSIAELNLESKTAEERVKILREHPDLLQKFMKDQAELKLKERKKYLERSFKKREELQKKQTQEIQKSHPEYKPKELVMDFVTYNAKQQSYKHQNPATKLVKQKQKAAQLDFKTQLNQLRKKENIQIKRKETIQKLAKPPPNQILPQTYLAQRKKLLGFIHLASNLANLRNISSIYSEVNLSNVKISQSTVKIQQAARMFLMRSIFVRQLEILHRIQYKAKIYLTKQHQDERLAGLKKIKLFLNQQYQRNTFLGGFNKFTTDANTLHSFLVENQQRKNARKALYLDNLIKADLNTTVELLKQQKLKEQDTSKDAKKRKKLAPDEIQITEEEIQLMRIKESQIVWQAVIEIVYNKLKFDRRDLYENQMDNKYQELAKMFYDPNIVFLEKTCYKVKQLGMEVENGQWIHEQLLVDWITNLNADE